MIHYLIGIVGLLKPVSGDSTGGGDLVFSGTGKYKGPLFPQPVNASTVEIKIAGFEKSINHCIRRQP
jgi:hypothetical protein